MNSLEENLSDGSIHLSKRPPEIIKSSWPCETLNKLPNMELSSINNEEIGVDHPSRDLNSRKRKRNWNSNKKSGNYSLAESQCKFNNPEVFKSMTANRSIRSRWSFSAITKNLQKNHISSDFRNLSSLHYGLINDQCTFTQKTEKPKGRGLAIRFPKIVKITEIKKFFTSLPLMIAIIKTFGAFWKKILKWLRSEAIQINPNSPYKIAWDMITMCLCLFQLFCFSIEKCFLVDLDRRTFETLFVVALYIDLILSFNTTIFKKGNAITNRIIIIRNMISKKLLSGLAPCFCLSIIVFSDNDSYSFLNLVLLAKIVKDEKLSQRLRDLIIRTQKGDAIYQMIVLIIKIFSCAHLIAVLWHYVGVSSSKNNPEANTWLKEKGIDGKDWSIKYLFSIYWGLTTMLTVGYGDITPQNAFEMIYNIFAMFLGCCLFGYSLNKIGEILSRYHRKRNYLDEQMSRVSYMLQNKNYPLEKQSKIKRYLEFLWKQELKEDPEHENFIMNKLSSDLRKELYLHSNVRYLKQVPAFKTFSDKTLIALSRYMKKACYCPEDFIYRVGDYENPSVYFVLDGNLKLVTTKDEKIITVLKKYKQGDYFGEREVFTGAARAMGIISIDFSTLFRLSRADLIHVLKKYPADYEKFCHTKDLDILYCKYDHYNEPCISCGLKDHPVEKCEYLRYLPIQRLIIHKHLRKQKMKTNGFKRAINKSYNALLEGKTTLAAQVEFLGLYQEDEELNELMSFYSCEEEGKYRKASENHKQMAEEQERERMREFKRFSTLNETFGRQASNTKMSRKSFITANKQKIGNLEDADNSNIKSSVEDFPTANEKYLDEISLASIPKESNEEFSKKSPRKTADPSYLGRDDADISLEGIKLIKKNENTHKGPSDSLLTANKKTQQEIKPKKEDFSQLQMDAIRIYQFYFTHNNFTELKKNRIIK